MLIQTKVKGFKGPALTAEIERSSETFTFIQTVLIKRNPD